MRDYVIENVVLEEHFDRMEYTGPLTGDDRAVAISYYKHFKDYGVRMFPIIYKDLKDILTLFYELELQDIAKAKDEGADSVHRDTKFARLLLEDKYYLEECLRQTNECRHNTKVLEKQWVIKRKFEELEAFSKLVHVQYEGAKPAGALQRHEIHLRHLSDITTPFQRGCTFFGGDYAMSVSWYTTVKDAVLGAVKMLRHIEDDELTAIVESIVELWKDFVETIKPYYVKVLKASKMATVTVCGKATKLEIITTPQYDVKPSQPYGWYVLALNSDSNQWEYTSISGWEVTTTRCLEAYYTALYRAYLKSQLLDKGGTQDGAKV